MKKKICIVIFCGIMFFISNALTGTEEYKDANGRISVEEGEAWIHDFPLFMDIKLKNSPQIAIWMEDKNGVYLSTLFVTHRIATGS